jgi:2-polyprenyl-3-methyl-5-hydroxy-6-metoxy-1,4-benzoquinol methylase
VTQQLQSDASRELYDAWHRRHEVEVEADSPWHEMIKARLDPERDIKGRRILEIGCGRGGFACWLARHPAGPGEVVAADFSPAAVDKAEQFATRHGIDGISWSVANIQDLDQFGPDFDTVFSCETIEHVPDPPLAVRQLARVLKPGGRLYLTTPNYLSMIGVYRAYCWARGKRFDEGGQPICQLTMIRKTRTWVRAAGLRVVEADSRGQYVPFPRRPPIRVSWLEHPRVLMRWFGLHSLVVGQKPA